MKLKRMPCIPTSVPRETFTIPAPSDDGTMTFVKVVDRSSIELPPYTDYDLSSLLAAGVPLKQLNATVIKPSDSEAANIINEMEKANEVFAPVDNQDNNNE